MPHVIGLAHVNSPYITVYRWGENGFGTKFSNPTSLPPAQGNCISFTKTGNAVALSHSNSPYISAYGWSSNGFGSKFSDPSTLPTGIGNYTAFTTAENALAVAHTTSPYISAYPWSGSGFGTKFSNPSTLPTNTGAGVAFTTADNAIAVGHVDSPNISVYPWSGSGFGTKFSNPSTLPPSSGQAVAFTTTDDAIAVGSDVSPFVAVYHWSGSGFGTKFSDPSSIPNSSCYGVDFTTSNNAIAFAMLGGDVVAAYEWSGSGFGTRFSNPSPSLSGLGFEVNFSSADDAIAIAGDSSPYITVYHWSESGFGAKFSNPDTLPAGGGRGVSILSVNPTGVLGGGSASVTFIDYIDGTGGAKVGGHGALIFNETASGGATVGGEAKLKWGIVNFCGFETGDFTEAYVENGITGGLQQVQDAVVRNGNYAMRVNSPADHQPDSQVSYNGYQGNGLSTETSLDEIYTRVFFRYGLKPSFNHMTFLWIGAGNTVTLGVALNSDAKLEVRLTNIGYIYPANYTGTKVLSVDTWYRIEVYGSANTGAWELRIDGKTELSGNELQLKQFQRIVIGALDSAVPFPPFNIFTPAVDYYFDDLMIRDDEWCKNGLIDMLNVDADGFYTGWTAQPSGNKWDRVNDWPLSGGGILTSTTSGDIYTAAVSNPSFETAYVSAVKPIAGTVLHRANASIKLRFRSVTTNLDTDAWSVESGVFAPHLAKIVEKDPHSHESWSLRLDDIQVGLYLVTANGEEQVSEMAIMVNRLVLGPDQVNVGGSATVYVAFAPPLTPAGVICNGTATVRNLDFVPPSAGVICNGEATISSTYLTLGGVIIGGAANTAYNEPTSGGIIGSGTALHTLIIASAIESAGVICGGNAFVSLAHNISLQSSGVVCNGTAIIDTSNFVPPPAGVILNGTADNFATYPVIATGGAIGGGEASPQGFLFSQQVMGGAVVGGITATGVTGGGDAPTIAIYNITCSGGAVCSGTSDASAIYNPQTTGGAVCGGRATHNYNETTTPAYGVVASGQANYFCIFFESKKQEVAVAIPNTSFYSKYSANPNKRSPQYDGLTAWWPVITAGDNYLYEEIRGRNGTFSNFSFSDLQWRADTDRRGHAISLTGDGYFEVPDYPEHTIGTAATISCWINTSPFTTGTILEKKQLTTEGKYSLALSGGGLINQFSITDSLGNTTNLFLPYSSDDKWHLTTIVRANGGIKGYVDGKPSFDTLDNTVGTINPNGVLRFGEGLIANVDDIRFYNRALSAAEVEALYNAQTRWQLYENPTVISLGVIPMGTGVVCGGSASLGYGADLVSAGVLCGGSAKVEDGGIYYPTGGVVCGGTSTETAIYNPTATGGAICNGRESVKSIYNPTPSGGVVCNGQAGVYKFFEMTASGGVVCAGAAPNGFGEIGHGGVVCAGTSGEPQMNYNPVISGGIICGSNAIVTANYDTTVSGGTVCAGSANITFFDYEDGTGGVTCNGAAIAVATYNIIASAGAIAGGRARVAGANEEVPEGGAVCGGTCSTTFFDYVDGTGGAVCGGEAFTTRTFNEIGAGGAVCGGEAKYGVTFKNNGLGGARAGGRADVVYWMTPYLPTGGAVVSPQMVLTSIYQTYLSGGVVLGTHFGYNQEERMSGGVICTGDSFGYMYTEEGHGGVICTGSAQRSFDHIYRKVDCEDDAKVKCGYEKKDQFCASFVKVQGFSSKFIKLQRRDVQTVCFGLTGDCFGTVAFIPAITLCQQQIRLYPEDQSEPVTIQIEPEEPSTPFTMLMVSTDEVPEPPQNQTTSVLVKPRNTPQMGALRKAKTVKSKPKKKWLPSGR